MFNGPMIVARAAKAATSGRPRMRATRGASLSCICAAHVTWSGNAAQHPRLYDRAARAVPRFEEVTQGAGLAR
jgi:hypothetical protein